MYQFKRRVFKAFFISEYDQKIPYFQRYELAGGYHLHASEDYLPVMAEEDGRKVFVLGYCYDIRDSGRSIPDIAEELAEADEEARLEELDNLNGRYVIILTEADKVYVYSDATSFKPVFYNEDYRLVSSHEYLLRNFIKDIHGEKLSMTKLYNKGFLDLTNTDRVYKLSPSLELEVTRFDRRRVFPRKERVEKSVEELVDESSLFFEESNKWLEQQKNLQFSLTGGVDSRVSLALIKPIVNQVKFFTYLKSETSLTSRTLKKAYTNDEKIVMEIVDNLNLDHEFFHIDPERDKETEKYFQKIENTVSSKHSYQLSKHLNESPQFAGALHIKSTIQSIGKSSYDKHLYDENTFDNMMRGISKWAPSVYKGEENKEAFESLIKGFMKRSLLDMEGLHGYHALDIMFLESRLGNFQSNITQETDNTLDIFNHFNSRKMIEHLLSPSLEDRQNQAFVKKIVDRHWPILNFFAINDGKNLMESYNSLLREGTDRKIVKNSLEYVIVEKCENLTAINQGGHIDVVPISLPLSVDEKYSVELRNNNEVEFPVTIQSFYTNEKGRGAIIVKINDRSFDIIDLNEGLKLILEPDEKVSIRYFYESDKNKKSWLDASKIKIFK
ncbi:hypothetical protein [Salinicoccus bachuensis]|uniref:Asparagine synthetase domain-containing protein n=1 Tax=Salinicoccus bachuensis TaxID=3136731 RepID=A0ABZ3CJK2_9STAP